ncbi:MAG: D-alanyl-D-alanine carboxypeptidase, partial [Actinobacteria bacterium]|nr:D-alanyl-D-alanine carboxypeptidase [Actinomycetota bacterium]
IYGEENSKAIPSDRIGTVATSALVMDYNTGEIYWEKNMNSVMYPASTTKIMTAILAIENISDFNYKIKISKNASGSNNSSITFRKGDEITLIDLLKASLIISTNNAAVALAEYVAGDTEKFVDMMNKKAKEIGALNTNFENTNGLDSNFPLHKTTAGDLAKIASYCMKNELFKEIVSTKEAVIHINKKEINIQNTNTLLGEDFIKGIKTGYTENAGYCLVAYSKKNNMELITVVLNSSPYGKNYDAMRLINWVYDNISIKKIVDSKNAIAHAVVKNNNSTADFNLYPENNLELLVNRAEDNILFNYTVNENISFPVESEKTYGQMAVYVNGDKIKEINLISKENINAPLIKQEINNKNDSSQIRMFLIFIISFYFLIFTIIIIKNLIKPKVIY